MVRMSSSVRSLSLLLFFLKHRGDFNYVVGKINYYESVIASEIWLSPVIKAYTVQKELYPILFSELLLVVFDDSGHVLDMTFNERQMTQLSSGDTHYQGHSLFIDI